MTDEETTAFRLSLGEERRREFDSGAREFAAALVRLIPDYDFKKSLLYKRLHEGGAA